MDSISNLTFANENILGTASNNVVVNLDSYGNHDPRKNGESADGIGIKEGSGTGNVIRGSRFWNNVDDGLDFWYARTISVDFLTSLLIEVPLFREFLSPVTVENCYSWGNGFNRYVNGRCSMIVFSPHLLT